MKFPPKWSPPFRQGSIPGMKPQGSGLLTEVGSLSLWSWYPDDFCKKYLKRRTRVVCLRGYQPAQQGVGSQRFQNGIQLKFMKRKSASIGLNVEMSRMKLLINCVRISPKINENLGSITSVSPSTENLNEAPLCCVVCAVRLWSEEWGYQLSVFDIKGCQLKSSAWPLTRHDF